jgi:hypothetical protein
MPVVEFRNRATAVRFCTQGLKALRRTHPKASVR